MKEKNLKSKGSLWTVEDSVNGKLEMTMIFILQQVIPEHVGGNRKQTIYIAINEQFKSLDHGRSSSCDPHL